MTQQEVKDDRTSSAPGAAGHLITQVVVHRMTHVRSVRSRSDSLRVGFTHALRSLLAYSQPVFTSFAPLLFQRERRDIDLSWYENFSFPDGFLGDLATNFYAV
jgi:hypothetical protein